MKGYLLKDQEIIIGEETLIESVAAENNYQVIFEDDSTTGYFYAAEIDKRTREFRILDMLLIYDVESINELERSARLYIIWTTDWMKCGLILNDYCHAVFDFKNKGGYNRLKYPPPVLWIEHERTLTDKMIAAFFE